jgi:hypothetical protein
VISGFESGHQPLTVRKGTHLWPVPRSVISDLQWPSAEWQRRVDLGGYLHRHTRLTPGTTGPRRSVGSYGSDLLAYNLVLSSSNHHLPQIPHAYYYREASLELWLRCSTISARIAPLLQP